MALALEDKKAIVAEVSRAASEALSLVIADYSGLTVAEMIELRAKAREAKIYMKIVRNTLAKRALEGTDFACVNEALTGPLVLAFANEEPGAGARLVRDFAKEHENLEVKALSIDGQLLPATSLETMAKLPTRDEALSMLLSVMQAPITQMVRTLAEPQEKLVRVIAAVKEQKEAA
ncbi:MAG: 50S ribosomal protein L10 [Gammaproteobacteria bacterium]|nr:50S ribosomal protein L10 [Gammaproteobacteria bacterium]